MKTETGASFICNDCNEMFLGRPYNPQYPCCKECSTKAVKERLTAQAKGDGFRQAVWQNMAAAPGKRGAKTL